MACKIRDTHTHTHLEMWPGGFQRRFVFFWVIVCSYGWRQSTEYVLTNLGERGYTNAVTISYHVFAASKYLCREISDREPYRVWLVLVV